MSDGISAGPAASFLPLPAEVLSYVPPPPAADPGAVVDYTAPPQALRAEALSLSFNPYASSATGSGDVDVADVSPVIARLRLSDASGAEMLVQNLSQPISFTVTSALWPAAAAAALSATAPSSSRSSNRLPRCVFWDPSAKRFSGEGCAALPSPRPPGWAVRWIPGFRPQDTRDLAARGWVAEQQPTAAAGSSGGGGAQSSCIDLVVDCAAHPSGALVRPYLQDPFAAPAVICPEWIVVNGTVTRPAANASSSNSSQQEDALWLNATAGPKASTNGSPLSSNSSAGGNALEQGAAVTPPLLRVFGGCEITYQENAIGCWCGRRTCTSCCGLRPCLREEDRARVV